MLDEYSCGSKTPSNREGTGMTGAPRHPLRFFNVFSGTVFTSSLPTIFYHQFRVQHARPRRRGFRSQRNRQDHQMYLALGRQGFLIGDGALKYARENIVETYYTAHVWRGIYVV